MKMMLGTGTISNYGSYTKNCQARQYPYKLPITSLADVQLYIAIGLSVPSTVQYELINTCGPDGGNIDAIAPAQYVIGQDTNDNYYGVFKNFSGSSAQCFVIAITLDSQIYFSEEYCIENSCDDLTLVKSCYGHLDPLISYDREGIYFGISQGGIMGDATTFYEHKMYLRGVEVTFNSIKNTFKQGRTRTFRVEAEDIYLLWAEWIPEWYLKHVDAIFKRGEVYIGSTRYLLDATAYEKIDECKKTWKIPTTFKESYFQSFGCEVDPCAELVEECCDPEGITAIVEVDESGVLTCCDPEIISADVGPPP